MLCEEAGHFGNVQYVGYCAQHWAKKVFCPLIHSDACVHACMRVCNYVCILSIIIYLQLLLLHEYHPQLKI